MSTSELRDIAEAIVQIYSWSSWFSNGVGTVGYLDCDLTKPVEVVEVFNQSEWDSYGYLINRREAGIVFKVGDRFFKKVGEATSYGDVQFIDYVYEDEDYDPALDFSEVKKITRSVSEYR